MPDGTKNHNISDAPLIADWPLSHSYIDENGRTIKVYKSGFAYGYNGIGYGLDVFSSADRAGKLTRRDPKAKAMPDKITQGFARELGIKADPSLFDQLVPA